MCGGVVYRESYGDSWQPGDLRSLNLEDRSDRNVVLAPHACGNGTIVHYGTG